MLKIFVLWALLCPLGSKAQKINYSADKQNDKISGVFFETELSWPQIIAKAKRENKFIFVDCFTTWCGPCKRMDEEVYPNEKVAEYMNARFISVKVQIDQTPKDNRDVKRFYEDAAFINKQYKIASFPTYLFFSPDGKIVHRATSYNKPEDFISIAQKALNPKEQYYLLFDQYEKGEKDYSLIPHMISMAQKSGETERVKTLTVDYLAYLSGLPVEELYTRERIEIISGSLSSTNSKFLKLFYPDGKKVNAIMSKGDFAWRTTNDAITREIFGSTEEMFRANPQPDWNKLYAIIKSKYGTRHADAVILWRKSRWHESDADRKEHALYFVELLKKDGIDTTGDGDGTINAISFVEIFGLSSDPNQIKIATKSMEGVLRRIGSVKPEWDASMYEWAAVATDTYACLLYKGGKKEEAILWEKKALRFGIESGLKGDIDDYEAKIEKMEKGETFWQLDFSGNWVLEKESLSETVLNFLPKKMSVLQNHDSILIKSSLMADGDHKETKYTLLTDGKPRENISSNGEKVITQITQQYTGFFDGRTKLTFTTVYSSLINELGNKFSNEQNWQLSFDGQRLILQKKAIDNLEETSEIFAVFKKKKQNQ